jgi:hypothetical protein
LSTWLRRRLRRGTLALLLSHALLRPLLLALGEYALPALLACAPSLLAPAQLGIRCLSGRAGVLRSGRWCR